MGRGFRERLPEDRRMFKRLYCYSVQNGNSLSPTGNRADSYNIGHLFQSVLLTPLLFNENFHILKMYLEAHIEY